MKFKKYIFFIFCKMPQLIYLKIEKIDQKKSKIATFKYTKKTTDKNIIKMGKMEKTNFF